MTSMNKLFAALGSATFVLLGAGIANAQVTSDSAAGSGNTAVELTLKGNVISAVELVITPSAAGNTAFTTAASNTMPTRSLASIDFGTFSTVNPTLTNGVGVRTAAASPVAGAHAVASLNAKIVANGISAATIGIERKAAFNAGASAPRDIAAADLKYSTSAPAWTLSSDGTAVPASGSPTNLCATVAACRAGVDHQLAVFVADTQAADSFSTVVLYTGTGS